MRDIYKARSYIMWHEGLTNARASIWIEQSYDLCGNSRDQKFESLLERITIGEDTYTCVLYID